MIQPIRKPLGLTAMTAPLRRPAVIQRKQDHRRSPAESSPWPATPASRPVGPVVLRSLRDFSLQQCCRISRPTNRESTFCHSGSAAPSLMNDQPCGRCVEAGHPRVLPCHSARVPHESRRIPPSGPITAPKSAGTCTRPNSSERIQITGICGGCSGSGPNPSVKYRIP